MMVTCKKLVAFLDDYVADALDDKTRRRFEFHLKLCRPCRRYLESYRRTIQASRQALAVDPAEQSQMPDEMVHAIVSAMRSDADPTSGRPAPPAEPS
jgi:anti-sigma factor RsiW